MDKEEEYRYILDFVWGNVLDDNRSYYQLRCLWTAFCFHYDLDVDTRCYDAYLEKIYASIPENTADRYDDFYNFMCEYMV